MTHSSAQPTRDNRDRLRAQWWAGGSGATLIGLGLLMWGIAAIWIAIDAHELMTAWPAVLQLLKEARSGASDITIESNLWAMLGILGGGALVMLFGTVQFARLPHVAARVAAIVGSVALGAAVTLAVVAPDSLTGGPTGDRAATDAAAVVDTPTSDGSAAAPGGLMAAPLLLALAACFTAIQQAAYGARANGLMLVATVGLAATLGLGIVALGPVPGTEIEAAVPSFTEWWATQSSVIGTGTLLIFVAFSVVLVGVTILSFVLGRRLKNAAAEIR